uniref:Peptidase_M14 domain-containing protein n=1 Tax=Steinernema glaseri TaxID=37863 RepID=A0A1I8A8Y5_9BILA
MNTPDLIHKTQHSMVLCDFRDTYRAAPGSLCYLHTMKAAVLFLLFATCCLSLDLDKYHTFEDIMAYLKEVGGSDRNRIKLIEIGRSIENRPLKVIKIGTTGPALWIDATIHAREWLSTAVALKLIDRLANGRELGVTYYILPVMNPDGYAFTKGPTKEERFYRKNRRQTSCATGNIGVDLNRNWDFNFQTNPDLCIDIYPGEYAFSEPETRAVRDFLVPLKPKLYIALHTYGQILLLPQDIGFNHPTRLTALKAARAMQVVNGTDYYVGTSKEAFNSASGGISKDWAYHKLGAKYSFTWELRPRSTRNEFRPTCDKNYCAFHIHEREIEGTFQEVWEGLKVFMEKILSE